MKLIGQGNTAEIYDFDDGRILKLFREGITEYTVQHEYNSSCIVYKALGNLVPRVYEIKEYEGRLGIIYEKIEGIDMLKKIFSDMLHIKRNSKEVARCHISIQREISEVMITVKEKLRSDIERVNELREDEKSRILKVLSTLPEGKVLCHMDFHPGNIMLQKDTPIFIDWMTVCVGDPLADVARTCILLKYAEIPGMSGVVNWFARFLKKRLLRHYLREYLLVTGVSMEKVREWYLPIMAARLTEWIPDKEKMRLLSEIKKMIEGIK